MSRPAVSESSRKTAGPSGVVAVIRKAAATVAAGTRYFVPVRTYSSPSGAAVVVGLTGACSCSSAIAQLRTAAAPDANASPCCPSLPCSPMNSRATESVANGTGATVRPTSTSTRHSSRSPSPAPSCDSGVVRVSSPASSSARHSTASKRSPAASTSAKRAGVAWSLRIVAASSAASSASAEKVKSIVRSSALRGRQAEADIADDVSLDLVRPTAEGHHQR